MPERSTRHAISDATAVQVRLVGADEAAVERAAAELEELTGGRLAFRPARRGRKGEALAYGTLRLPGPPPP